MSGASAIEEMCHCGRPLHYKNPSVRANVDRLIALVGDAFVTITQLETGRSFRVPRHYIALHGIKGWELDQLGFEELKGAR